MTSSAGMSGLIFPGPPPRARMASRIAARPTTVGTPGQVLQEHLGRGELDLGGVPAAFGGGVPKVGEGGADLRGGDVDPVLVAEQVLQQDLQAEREGLRPRDGVEPVDLVLVAGDVEHRPAAEAVRAHRPLQ